MEIYNLLHLIVNIIIVIELFTETNVKLIIILICLLHLFHMIFYKLKNDEYIHHILTFVAILLFLNDRKYLTIHIIKPLIFFIIGFPGIINYFLKVVNKSNNIIKYVNMFIRSPGIIGSCIYLLYNKITINILIIIIMAIIDAIYYIK
jgi:hypothetical protein